MSKQVQRALDMLAEIDHIILANSKAPKKGYDPFMSLVHQKEGLIDLVKRETGRKPHWTINGYDLG